MANERKRKRHTGAKVTAATAVLLAALAGGSFGFRHSGLNIPGVQNNDRKGPSAQESIVPEQAPAQDDGTMHNGGSSSLFVTGIRSSETHTP